MTLAAARAVVEAARKKAEKLGVPMNSAVVAGANLVRMDGAWVGRIEISQPGPARGAKFLVAWPSLSGIHSATHARPAPLSAPA